LNEFSLSGRLRVIKAIESFISNRMEDMKKFFCHKLR